MYKILKAEKLADKIYLMDVEAPRIAKACQPGEFVIVRMDERGERIPLTICDYDRKGNRYHRVPDRRSQHRENGWFKDGRFLHRCRGTSG